MTGLQMHEQAVRIEKTLNLALLHTAKDEPIITDITMVYDRPMHLCANVLDNLQHHTSCQKQLDTIQDIKEKNCTYYGYILSQLDKETVEALCNDLQKLYES